MLFLLSLCHNCSVQKKKLEDLQSEYNACKETFHRYIKTHQSHNDLHISNNYDKWGSKMSQIKEGKESF